MQLFQWDVRCAPVLVRDLKAALLRHSRSNTFDIQDVLVLDPNSVALVGVAKPAGWACWRSLALPALDSLKYPDHVLCP